MKSNPVVAKLPEREKASSYQIVTLSDLADFRIELLTDFKKLLKELSGHSPKRWMKSNEVRKMLGISPGTLQNLRINGTLPFTKIGGVIYYDAEDIEHMFSNHKQVHS